MKDYNAEKISLTNFLHGQLQIILRGGGGILKALLATNF